MYPCSTGPNLPSLPFYLLSYTLPKTISFNHHLTPFLSLSLPLYLSLLYRKPFLSISPLSRSPDLYFSAISLPPPRLLLSFSFSASHPSPGVFLGDQSSSSQRCHTTGSSQNTHACAHTFTRMSGQQMPRFTYDYSGEQTQWEKTHTHTLGYTYTYTQTHTIVHSLPHMYTCAHHLLAAGYNEMEYGLCQRRDGVTLWLCPAGSDPVTSSSSSSQPTQPPPSPDPERRAQSGLEGGAGNSVGCSGLHSLRQALSHAQPHHLNMTKYWHCRVLNSVCRFV